MEIGDSGWAVPAHRVDELAPKQTLYCVVIPVINENGRILRQLQRMQEIAGVPDVIIADGGSNDGSMDSRRLAELGVRTLLTKQDRGRLGAQLRMGFAYALRQGYDGVITVDGNEKDGVEAIPKFATELEGGADFVQGSRFVRGGVAANTPRSRVVAIRLVHAPLISMFAGFHYTDTTNAFRAHSRRLLLHAGLQPFRVPFKEYELLAYISVRAPQLGMAVKEIPVRRTYPSHGRVPTKISPWRGNLKLLRTLLAVGLRRYHPNRS
jgi:dolichol-phosphate mannosyltransferase